MRRILFIAICLFLLPTYLLAEEVEEKLRLAILDLSAKDVSAMTSSKVSELLRTTMFNTGLFTVIERNEMETILKEQKFTLTGCTDEKCGIRIGRLLSANKILVGTVMKLGNKIIINARIVDVEKGKLDFAEKTSCTKEEELDTACDDFANKISARILGRPYQPTAVAEPSVPTQTRTSGSVIIAKDGAEMVLIPEGEFLMGSPEGEGASNEHPQHKVYLDAYYIDKYEVTFEQYNKFCESTGRSKPSDRGWGRGNRPVINVTWDDAVAYAEWAGKRLPTEAEWEKACRAGSTEEYCFGIDLSFLPDQNPNTLDQNLGEYAWYDKNSGNKTHPVGEKKPNQYGIYDMHGNVWEWCADWDAKDYYKNSPYKNPPGPDKGSTRVLRGGSWYFYAILCRSASRFGFTPDAGLDDYGFRCASSAGK